ncbi:methyltransferase [bacterium]|nr:methyltransferase [bacterium]
MVTESKNINVSLPEEKLTVQVSSDGYWFGQEVIELVDFIRDKFWKRAADLGCGDGIIALLLARRKIAKEIWAIDIDEDHCQRTIHNINKNNLTGHIQVRNRNIRTLQNVFRRSSFDLITANPPFFTIDNDHQNIAPSEKAARQETEGNLRYFLQAADYLSSNKADMYLIYHPSRLDYLFNELKNTRFRCKHLQVLYHADDRALFVLYHGIKSGRSGISILPSKTLKKSIKNDLKG